MPCRPGRKAYPMPSQEELETAYKELQSIRLCARKFQVSDETMRTWLKTYGIQINAQGYNTNPRNKTWRIK